MAWKYFQPTHPLHRYFILVVICLMGFGSYFVGDIPAALQDQITSDMDISTMQFSTLVALYSYPNVLLCFFGGFLIDRVLGIRLGSLVCCALVLIGQSVMAFGAFINAFWIMQIGRFVFGMGGDTLIVAQSTYAVAWFKGKELNTAFGLQLSGSRIIATLAFNVILPLYTAISNFSSGYTCLGLVLFIGSLTCVFSLICGLALVYFDSRAEKMLGWQRNPRDEIVKITDFKKFGGTFWLIGLVCVTYYSAMNPFISLGTTFFRRKYHMVPHEANAVDSSVYIIAAIFSPLFGFAVDFTGLNLSWVFVSLSVNLLGHALIAFTYINPWFPMVIMGFGYALISSALYPMVAMVIPQNRLATAYGTMMSMQNLGVAIMTQMAGLIIDRKGYLMLEIFYLSSLCLSVIFVMMLLVTDAHHGGHLNMSRKQRIKIRERIDRAARRNRREMAVISVENQM